MTLLRRWEHAVFVTHLILYFTGLPGRGMIQYHQHWDRKGIRSFDCGGDGGHISFLGHPSRASDEGMTCVLGPKLLFKLL